MRWGWGGEREWVPFLSLSKKLWVNSWNCICKGLCPEILPDPFSNQGFWNEALGSLHCLPHPVSDPRRVTGFWDYRQAVVRTAVGKGRDFPFLKVLKKINTSNLPRHSSFVVFPAWAPPSRKLFLVQVTTWPQWGKGKDWQERVPRFRLSRKTVQRFDVYKKSTYSTNENRFRTF